MTFVPPLPTAYPAALAALEADASLRGDPRLLDDPRFLGAVRVQLEARLGPEEAAAALLQIGFLHGIRDAAAVVRSGPVEPALAPITPTAFSPRVPFRLSPSAAGEPGAAGRFDLEGSWIDGLEGCHASAGYVAGWLTALFDTEMLVIEARCVASGGPGCDFRARPAADCVDDPDPGVRHALAALDYARLRQLLERERAEEPHAPLADDQFDYGAPVVHVWGPVMVVPFSGPDDTIAAVELIGRDEGARDVRVVVVDLGYAVVDEDFGALALERVLEAVESWGAEALLAGVSPLSEPAVAGLEVRHATQHKDLPEAIAAAFQIAYAHQRSC